MTVGNEIAAAHRALEPAQAALVIYRALFEVGPSRLAAADRFIAIGTITAGLVEWRKQLLMFAGREITEMRKKYTDAKAELDDVKLRLAILEKER